MSWSVTYAFDDEGVPYENVKFNTFKVCDAPNKKVFHFTRGYTRIRVKGLYTDSCHTSDNLKLQNVAYDFILDVSKSANNCITGVSTDRHLKATWNAPLGRNLLTIQPNICSGGCSVAANDPQKFIITVTEVRGYGPLLSSYRMMTPKKMLEFEEDERDRYKYFVNVTDPEEIKIYAMQIKLISTIGESQNTFETPLTDSDQYGLSKVLKEELYYKPYITSGNVIANELFHDFRRLDVCNQHVSDEDPDVPDFHLYMEIFNHKVKVLWDVRQRALMFLDVATGNRMKMEILKVIYSHTGDLVQNYTLKNADLHVFKFPYHTGEKFDITNGCIQLNNGVKSTTGQYGFYSWLLPAVYQKVEVKGKYKSKVTGHDTSDVYENFDINLNMNYNMNIIGYNTVGRQGAKMKALLNNNLLSLESLYKVVEAGEKTPPVPDTMIDFKNYGGFNGFSAGDIASICSGKNEEFWMLKKNGDVFQGRVKNGTVEWFKLPVGQIKTKDYMKDVVPVINGDIKIVNKTINKKITLMTSDNKKYEVVCTSPNTSEKFYVDKGYIQWDSLGLIYFCDHSHNTLSYGVVTGQQQSVTYTGNILPTTYNWKCISYNTATNTLIVGGFSTNNTKCHIFYYHDSLWWERTSFTVINDSILKIANAGNICAYMTLQNSSNGPYINYINVPTLHDTREDHKQFSTLHSSPAYKINNSVLYAHDTKIVYILMSSGSGHYLSVFDCGNTNTNNYILWSGNNISNIHDVCYHNNKYYCKMSSQTESFIYTYNSAWEKFVDFKDIGSGIADNTTTHFIDNYIVITDIINGKIYYKLNSDTVTTWQTYTGTLSGATTTYSNNVNALLSIPTVYTKSVYALFNTAKPLSKETDCPNFDVIVSNIYVEGPIYAELQDYIDNYTFEKTYRIDEINTAAAGGADGIYHYTLTIPNNESPNGILYRDIKGFCITGTVRSANCSIISDFVINGMDYQVYKTTPNLHQTALGNPKHYRAYSECGRYYIETTEGDAGTTKAEGTKAVSFAIFERSKDDHDGQLGIADGTRTRMEIQTIKYRENDVFQKCVVIKANGSSIADEVSTPSGWEFKRNLDHSYCFRFDGRRLTEFNSVEVLLHKEYLVEKQVNTTHYSNENVDKNIRFVLDCTKDFNIDYEKIDDVTLNNIKIHGCAFSKKCEKTVNNDATYTFAYDYFTNTLSVKCGTDIIDMEMEIVKLNDKEYTRSLSRDENVLMVKQPVIQAEKYEEPNEGNTITYRRYHTSYRSWSTVYFVRGSDGSKLSVVFKPDEFGDGNKEWYIATSGLAVIWTDDNILKFTEKCVLLSIEPYDISRETTNDASHIIRERSQIITFWDVEQMVNKPPLTTKVDELNEFYTYPSLLTENVDYKVLLRGAKPDGGAYYIFKTYNYYELLVISFKLTYIAPNDGSNEFTLDFRNLYLSHMNGVNACDWDHPLFAYYLKNSSGNVINEHGMRMFYGDYNNESCVYISIGTVMPKFELNDVIVHGIDNWRNKKEEYLHEGDDYIVTNNEYTIHKNYNYISCDMKYKITGNDNEYRVWIKRICGVQGRKTIQRDEYGNQVRAEYTMNDECNKLVIKYFGDLSGGKTFNITSMNIYGHPEVLTSLTKFSNLSNKVIKITNGSNGKIIHFNENDNIKDFVINFDVYNANYSLKRNYTVDLHHGIVVDSITTKYNLGLSENEYYKLIAIKYANYNHYLFQVTSIHTGLNDYIRFMRIRYIKDRITGARMNFTVDDKPGELVDDYVIMGLNGFSYQVMDAVPSGNNDNTLKQLMFVTCDNKELLYSTITLRIHEASERNIDNINYPEHRGTYIIVNKQIAGSNARKYATGYSGISWYRYDFDTGGNEKYQKYGLFYYPEMNAIGIRIRQRNNDGTFKTTFDDNNITNVSIYSIKFEDGSLYYRTDTESKLLKYAENEGPKMIERDITYKNNQYHIYKYVPRNKNVYIYIDITYTESASVGTNRYNSDIIHSDAKGKYIDASSFNSESEPWILYINESVFSSHHSGPSSTTHEIYKWYMDGIITIESYTYLSDNRLDKNSFQRTYIIKILPNDDNENNYSKIATENYVKEAIGESIEQCNNIELSGRDLEEFQTRSNANGSNVSQLHEFLIRRNYKNVSTDNTWKYKCTASGSCAVATPDVLNAISLEGNYNDTVSKFIANNHFGLAYVMLDGLNKILMMKPSNVAKTQLTQTGKITLSGPIVTPKATVEAFKQSVKPVEITYEKQKCVVGLKSGWANGIRDYIVTFNVYSEGLTREITIDMMEMKNIEETTDGVTTWRLTKDCYTFECKNIYDSTNKCYNFSFDCMNERKEYRRLYIKKIVYANGMVEIPVEYKADHHEVDHKDDYYTVRNIDDELVVNYNNNLDNCIITMLLNDNIHDVECSRFNTNNPLTIVAASDVYLYYNKETNGLFPIVGKYTRNGTGNPTEKATYLTANAPLGKKVLIFGKYTTSATTRDSNDKNFTVIMTLSDESCIKYIGNDDIKSITCTVITTGKEFTVQSTSGTNYNIYNVEAYPLASKPFDIIAIKCKQCNRYIPREPSEIYTYNYPNTTFSLTSTLDAWNRIERNYSTIKFKLSYTFTPSGGSATNYGPETITIEGNPLKPTVLKWNHYTFTYIMHHNYNLFKCERESGSYAYKFNYIDQPSSDNATNKVTLCGPLKTYINDFHNNIKFPKETDEDYTEYIHKSERNPEERLHNHQLVLKHTHNAYEFEWETLMKYVIECDIWNNTESMKERVTFDCGTMKHRRLNLGLKKYEDVADDQGPFTMFAKGKYSTYTLINDSNVLWVYDDSDINNRLGPLVYRIITVRERQSLIEIPFTEDSAYVTTRPVNTGETGVSETKDYPHYCAGGYEIAERKYREYEFSCDGRSLDEFDISMYVQADDLEATGINEDKTQESRIKSNLLKVDFGYDRVSSGATIPDADEKAGGWIREGAVILCDKNVTVTKYDSNGTDPSTTTITDDSINKVIYKAGSKGFKFTAIPTGKNVVIPVGTKVKNVGSAEDNHIPANATKILEEKIELSAANNNLVILELPENPLYKWKIFNITIRGETKYIKIEHFCTHNMIRIVKVTSFDYKLASSIREPLLGISIEKVTLRSKSIPIPAKITLAKTNSNVPFEFHRNYAVARDSANKIPGSHVSVYRTPYRCRARFTYVRGNDGWENGENPTNGITGTILEDGEFTLPTDKNEWFIDGYKDEDASGTAHLPSELKQTTATTSKTGTYLRYRVDGHRIRIPSIKWNEDGTIIAKMDLRYEWTGTAGENNKKYYFGDNEWFVITSITALDAMNHEIPREYATVNDIFALKDDLTGAQEHETCMVLKSDDNKYQFVLSDEADITTCTIKGYIETLPFEITLSGTSPATIGDTNNSGYRMYYSTDAKKVVTIYAACTTETSTYIPLVFSKIHHGNVLYKIIQDDSIETSADIIPIYIPYKLIATPTRSGANYSFLTRFCRIFVNIKNGSTIVERLIFDIDDVKGTKFFAKNNKLYNLSWNSGVVSCNQDATALAADAWEITLVMRLYNLLDKINITQDNINKRYKNKTEVYCNVTAGATYDASAKTSKEYIEKNNGYLVPSDDDSKFVFFISDYLCVKHTCDVYVNTTKTTSLERVTHCDNYSFNTYTCTLASGVIYDVYLFKDDTYNVLGIVNKSANAKGINLLTLTGITKYFTNEDSAVYEDNKREIIQEGTNITAYELSNDADDMQSWSENKHILTYTKQIGIYKFNYVAGHEDRIVYVDNLNKSWYQFTNAKDHALYWKDNKLRCCKITVAKSRKWQQPNTNGSTCMELVKYTPALPFHANDTYKLVKSYTVDKTDTDKFHFVLDPISYKRDNVLIYELPLLDKIIIVKPEATSGANAPASDKTLCAINYDISKNEVLTVESTDSNKILKCKYWFERSIAILIVELRNNSSSDSFKIYIPPDASLYRCMMKEEEQINNFPLKITEKQSARKNYTFSHDFASLSMFEIEFICADGKIHKFDFSRIEKNNTDYISHDTSSTNMHYAYRNIVTSTDTYNGTRTAGTYYRIILSSSWTEFVLVCHKTTGFTQGVEHMTMPNTADRCSVLQILGIKTVKYMPTNEYINYEFEGISPIGESSKGIGNNYMNDNNFILMRKGIDKYTFTCGPYPISTYEIKLEYPVITPSNFEYCIYIYNHNGVSSTKEQIADTNPAIYGFLMKTVPYDNKDYKYYLVVDSQEMYIMLHNGTAASRSADLTIEIISVKSLITGKYMSGVDSGKTQESVGININSTRYDMQTMNTKKNYFIQENLVLQSIKFTNCSAVDDNNATKVDNTVYSTLGFKLHKFIELSIAKTISYNNLTIEITGEDANNDRPGISHKIYIYNTKNSKNFLYSNNTFGTDKVYNATVKYNNNIFTAVLFGYTVVIVSDVDEFYYMMKNVFGTSSGGTSLIEFGDLSAFPVPTFKNINLLKTNADGKKDKFIYSAGYTSSDGAETIRASKGNNIEIKVDGVICTLEIVDKDCKKNSDASMLYKFTGGTWLKNTAEGTDGYGAGNFCLINGIYIFDCILHKSSEKIQCILYNNHLIKFDKTKNDRTSSEYINRYLTTAFNVNKTKIYVINISNTATANVTTPTTKVLEILDGTAANAFPTHTSTFETCYYACELNEANENIKYKHTSSKDYPSYYLSSYNPLSNAGYKFGNSDSTPGDRVLDYSNTTIQTDADTTFEGVTVRKHVIYGDESKLRTILNGTIPADNTRFCKFTRLSWNTEQSTDKPKVKHGYIKLIGYKGTATPFDSANLVMNTISIIEGYYIVGLGNHNFKINPKFQCQNGYNISSISDMYMPPKPIFNSTVTFQIVNLDDNGSNIRCIAFGDYLLRGSEKVFGSDYNNTFNANGTFTKLYTTITDTANVQSVYVDYVNNSSYKFDNLPEKLLLNAMKCTTATDSDDVITATPDKTTQYGFYGYKLSGLHKIDYNLINYITFQNDENILITNVASLVKFNEKLYYNPTIVEQNGTDPIYNNVVETFYIVEGMIKLSQWETSKKCIIIHDYILMCEISQFMNNTSAMDKIIMTEIKIPYPTTPVPLETKLLTSVQQYKAATDYVYTFTSPDFYQQLQDSDYYEWKYDNATIEIVQGPKIFTNRIGSTIFATSNCFLAACKVTYTYNDFTINYKGLLIGNHIICEKDVTATVNASYTNIYNIFSNNANANTFTAINDKYFIKEYDENVNVMKYNVYKTDSNGVKQSSPAVSTVECYNVAHINLLSTTMHNFFKNVYIKILENKSASGISTRKKERGTVINNVEFYEANLINDNNKTIKVLFLTVYNIPFPIKYEDITDSTKYANNILLERDASTLIPVRMKFTRTEGVNTYTVYGYYCPGTKDYLDYDEKHNGGNPKVWYSYNVADLILTCYTMKSDSSRIEVGYMNITDNAITIGNKLNTKAVVCNLQMKEKNKKFASTVICLDEYLLIVHTKYYGTGYDITNADSWIKSLYYSVRKSGSFTVSYQVYEWTLEEILYTIKPCTAPCCSVNGISYLKFQMVDNKNNVILLSNGTNKGNNIDGSTITCKDGNELKTSGFGYGRDDHNITVNGKTGAVCDFTWNGHTYLAIATGEYIITYTSHDNAPNIADITTNVTGVNVAENYSLVPQYIHVYEYISSSPSLTKLRQSKLLKTYLGFKVSHLKYYICNDVSCNNATVKIISDESVYNEKNNGVKRIYIMNSAYDTSYRLDTYYIMASITTEDKEYACVVLSDYAIIISKQEFISLFTIDGTNDNGIVLDPQEYNWMSKPIPSAPVEKLVTIKYPQLPSPLQTGGTITQTTNILVPDKTLYIENLHLRDLNLKNIIAVTGYTFILLNVSNVPNVVMKVKTHNGTDGIRDYEWSGTALFIDGDTNVDRYYAQYANALALLDSGTTQRCLIVGEYIFFSESHIQTIENALSLFKNIYIRDACADDCEQEPPQTG